MHALIPTKTKILEKLRKNLNPYLIGTKEP